MDMNPNINENNLNKNEEIISSSDRIPSIQENSSELKAKLPKATALLSDAWRLYKSRWKTFLGIIVVSVLLMIVAFIVFGIVTFVLGFLTAFVPEIQILNMIFFFISFVVLFSMIIIIQFWSQVALIYAIKDSAENIGIKESFRRGRHKIRSFFWVSVLASFIIMGGFLLFIIPGIIFSIWFSLAIYIVIAEDLKGMDAILKSREYIRKYWWSVLWRFLFFFIVIYIIMIVFGIAFFVFAYAISTILDFSLDFESFWMIVNFSMQIISFILAPLTIIYSFFVYRGLKNVKGDFEFKPSKKSKRSFIIVGIFGVLIFPIFFFSSIVLVSLNSAREKAVDASRYSEQQQVQIDLEIYYEENKGKYPKSLDQLDSPLINPKTKEYLKYKQLSNGNDYELCMQTSKEEQECINSWNSSLDMLDNKKNNNIYEDESSPSVKPIFKSDLILRDEKRIADLDEIKSTLFIYKMINEEFPISMSSSKLNEDNEIVEKIESVSLSEIPSDSKEGYYYSYISVDGKSFELSARLEDESSSYCEEAIKNMCIYKLKSE